MKSFDIKASIYIDFDKNNNKEDSRSNVGDPVRLSKYKNISSKVYVPNWSETFLWLKKLKTLCHGHILLMLLPVKK